MTKRLLLAFVVFAALIGAGNRVVNRGSAPTYLINQNFEGTGYDNSESWTEVGTVNEDYTPALVGSQSAVTTTAWGGMTSPSFSGQTTVWLYVRLKNQGTYWTDSGAVNGIIYIQDASDVVLAACRIQYSGSGGEPAKVYLNANGSDSSASATEIPNGTEHHFWLKFVSGGTCELYVSQSGTRPGTGDDGVGGAVYRSKTGATGTATKVALNAVNANHIIIDRILVSASEIGNNP